MRRFLKLRLQAVKHRRKVNGLIKLERNMWIADKADQLDAAFESGNMHDMYKHLGAITKYAKNKTSSQKICRVSNSEGLPTQSYAEEKLAFRSHFSSTMSAKTLTYGEVVQKDRDEYNSIGCLDRFKNVSFNDLCLQIPSPSEVIDMHSMSKKGKAPGEDLCSGNVLSAFPVEFMRIYYPLVLKTYVRIQPPIQWKGGMLQELFKGKGSSSVCSNFRDVMLACVDGKNVAKYIRSKLLPRAHTISLDTQFGGGFNGGETAFAHGDPPVCETDQPVESFFQENLCKLVSRCGCCFRQPPQMHRI